MWEDKVYCLFAYISCTKSECFTRNDYNRGCLLHEKDMMTGMPGKIIWIRDPVHAPVKMIGNRGPPMKPKPCEMPRHKSLVKAVTATVRAPSRFPSVMTAYNWGRPPPRHKGTATYNSPSKVPPITGCIIVAMLWLTASLNPARFIKNIFKFMNTFIPSRTPQMKIRKPANPMSPTMNPMAAPYPRKRTSNSCNDWPMILGTLNECMIGPPFNQGTHAVLNAR